MKGHPLHLRHLISIADLSKEEILSILDMAQGIKKNPIKKVFKNKILASCFFEPSTRTRLSFESAMIRLGGQVIGFSDANSISEKKGETLHDSIQVISKYADILVIRHPLDGAARLASEVSSIPVINAGDGTNQHPTQTLLDLFTIRECQGRLEGIQLAMVGDLKHARTIHSLALGCTHFGMRLFFVSQEQLTMPDHILQDLREKGIKFSFHKSVEEIIAKADIIYMTRLQKERLGEGEYETLKDPFVMTEKTLESAKKNLKILQPLPRTHEIDRSVDKTPFAYYFQQAENGVYVRQALLYQTLHVKEAEKHG